MRKGIFFLILLLYLNNSPLLFSKWKTLKNDSFTIFYSSGQEFLAREVLQTLESYRQAVEELVGNNSKNLPVVLEDVGSMSNGYADAVFKRIHLFTYPPSTGESSFSQNWWDLVGVHEYTHLLH